MNLRTRLIVAFFLLSVVPLTVVVYLSYASSAAALREGAEHETDLLASELGQRMQLVTTQLRDRAEYMMNVAQARADADAANQARAEQAALLAEAETMDQQAADALGDVAALLNNVELRGLTSRGGRGSRGRPPQPPTGEPGTGRTGVTPPPAPAPAEAEAPDQIRIDLRPIRRELFRELMPDGQNENLTPEQRAVLGREMNARMLGIAQGIQLTAAELERRAEQARQRAETAVVARAVTMKSAITGTRLDVTVERDGEVLGGMSADINLPATLATVFSTTHRDAGEVPFGVDQQGRIYASSDEDRVLVEGLGPVATPDGPASARVGNWIVVTTSNPVGAGLRLGIARPVGESLGELRRAAATNLAVGLGFIVLALIGIVPLSSGLTRNLTRLNDAVRRIALGDYTARVPATSGDEVGELGRAFNQMAEDVERHQRAIVGQERLKRELELGRQIQYDMLPRAPLRLGLTEIQGVSVPAREVGGDFFNYFELPDGQVALLVGDVAGKGVGAALLMANIQASLRTRLALGQDLSAVAEATDRDVEVNSPGPLYATLFVGILDPRRRLLRYVNAGHHPQFVLRKGGGLDRMESTGLPVGMLAGHGYVEKRVGLNEGDLLFFYTDGCVEAENETGEMFEPHRLEALLASGAEHPDDVLARVERAVTTFRGSREASDDATMMAVRIG